MCPRRRWAWNSDIYRVASRRDLYRFPNGQPYSVSNEHAHNADVAPNGLAHALSDPGSHGFADVSADEVVGVAKSHPLAYQPNADTDGDAYSLAHTWAHTVAHARSHRVHSPRLSGRVY